MKTKTQKNIKEIVSASIKNQTQLNDIFSNLKPNDLSKTDKESINAQLDELEALALQIKNKI